MVTINEINQTIISGNLTYDQLNSIAMALKLARTQMSQSKRFKFKLGERVKFASGATTYTGTVTKIDRKNVLVEIASGIVYRVPAIMLDAA